MKVDQCPQSPDTEHAFTKVMEARTALPSPKRQLQTMSQPSKRNKTAPTHQIVPKTQSGVESGPSGLPAQFPATPTPKLNRSR